MDPKRPLRPKDIRAIRFYLDDHTRLRDGALFDLAIDSKLRGCNLVNLKIGDVPGDRQFQLGHTNNENTFQYIGVDVDDALTLYQRTDTKKQAELRPSR